MKKRTQSEFIALATARHNGKYDYSKVKYVSNTEKVCIICPFHGEFWQRPSDHLRGVGCPKCAVERVHSGQKLKIEDVLEKAKNIHGEFYDYSKIREYPGLSKKVNIICPIHGEFYMSLGSHIHQRQGCPECGREKVANKQRMSVDTFVSRAISVHGDKYDYHLITEYENNRTKVPIVCHQKDLFGNEHGVFWQKPISHLITKCGCPKCGGKSVTNAEFLFRSRMVHGNKYDYSKVEYENTEKKVCIICPKHGEFWQTPHRHLEGNGCPKCAGMNRDTEQFIKEAKEAHGTLYDYSKTNYTGYKNKVCITCPEHGDFWQKPISHLNGRGCPYCKESKLEKKVRLFLTKEGIKFEYQKRFPWLGYQSLDFYLPDFKIAIECQGIQHFTAIDFAGRGDAWAEKLYQENVERDHTKKDKCAANGIDVLYYSDLGYGCIDNIISLRNEIYKHRKYNHQ